MEISEYRELLSITERINQGSTLDEILNNVYESFLPIIPYDRIGCAVIEAGDSQSPLVVLRWCRSRAPEILMSPGYEAKLSGSSLELVFETHQPRIINDLRDYLAKKPDSYSTRRMLREGMLSSLTCPLIAEGRAVGFLFFSSMKSNAYRDVHAELFALISGQVSLILHKGIMYDELRQSRDELERANEELKRLSAMDPLTGLPNRRHLDERLEVEWQRMMRTNEPVSLIMIDVDHFKSYNDRYGHQEGDRCIRRVASVLKDSLGRSSDFVARYGGEEFAAVLPGVGEDEALLVAERLCRRVKKAGEQPTKFCVSAGPTISLGVATVVPTRGGSAVQLIGLADKALYESKASGRNRVTTAPWRMQG